MKIDISLYNAEGRCMGRFACDVKAGLTFEEQVDYVKEMRTAGQLPKIGKKPGDQFILVVRDNPQIRVIMPEEFHGRQKTG